MNVRHTVPVLALLAALPATASAQSAADVMRDAREAYQERTRGIENYTVVQNSMGQETTTHFVRDERNGIVFFRPTDMPMDEAPGDPSMDPTFFYRPDVADRMAYLGMAEVDGHGCHEVRIEDFEGLGFDAMTGEQGRMRGVSFCVDEDEHVVRRMVMDMTTPGMGGEPTDVTMTVVLKDYRDVSGMLHPWRMEITTSGLGGEDAGSAMAQAMKQMEEQLEQLPEAQREQMREMMESRMEAMEGVTDMASGNTVAVEVLDVTVNQGPPGG